MKTKTLVMAAVMIAATAALALAPTITSTAMAVKPTGPPGGTQCVHNGNGATTEGPCKNKSGTTVVTTCEKVRGKFVCTTE
jgi:hypothetical protein